MWKILQSVPIFVTSIDHDEHKDALMPNKVVRVDPWIWLKGWEQAKNLMPKQNGAV